MFSEDERLYIDYKVKVEGYKWFNWYYEDDSMAHIMLIHPEDPSNDNGKVMIEIDEPTLEKGTFHIIDNRKVWFRGVSIDSNEGIGAMLHKGKVLLRIEELGLETEFCKNLLSIVYIPRQSPSKELWNIVNASYYDCMKAAIKAVE